MQKRIELVAGIASVMLLLSAATVVAEDEAEVIQTKAKAGSAEVETKVLKNDPDAVSAPPAQKADGKAKGAGPFPCLVHIDNRTTWIIHRVFVDGTHRGAVDRYGDGTLYVGNGNTGFYAEADFDDGSTRYWGPITVNCPAQGSYRWQLYP